jgi:undecaprenyl-diphosphatase
MNALEAYDLGTLYYLGSLHRPWLDEAARAVTWLGNNGTLAVVVVLAALAFVLLRRRRAGLAIVAASLAAWGLEYGVKRLVGRPRPDVAWRLIDLPASPSFPSGHALVSMAVYGTLGLLIAREVRRPWRYAVVAVGFALPIVIGLTRPYLGVHYLGDVIAGWVAGLACALTAGSIAEGQNRGSAGPEPGG